jgi:hypothetical protein
MAAAKLSDEAFSAILEAHPGLRERFASIAMAVANSGEKVLAGAKPVDLPVQQSTRVELVINLKMTRRLGITTSTARREN